MIHEVKNIKIVDVAGEYSKEFDAIDKKLEKIRQLLNNTTISEQVTENLESVVLNF